MCVGVDVVCSGTQLEGTSDSDSDTEDQVDFRINDWLIFQMDRNVSEQNLFPSWTFIQQELEHSFMIVNIDFISIQNIYFSAVLQ